LLAAIVKVEVLGEYTVVLHTAAPFAPLKAHLTHAFTVILSPTAIKALGGAIIEAPIGTGPFKFKEWVRGEHITLVANKNYWGGRPYLDEIIVRPIPEEATRIMMLEAGEVDVIIGVPPMDIPRLEADPAINMLIVPGLATDYIGLNNFRGPFSDVRVRHAVNYAIDRESFVEHILGGLGTVATAPIAPVVAGYHTAGPWPFNPERAKELLAEAGFPDGFRTTLRVTPPRLLHAEAVQADLREVGIEVEIIVTEWAAFLATIILPPAESVMDMFMLGWITMTGDADYGLFPLFHSSQWAPVGVNRVFYKNERVDELLAAGRVILDIEERKALYAEAIELIWQDAPWVFMFHRVESRAELVHVQGVVYRPDLILCFRSAWIKAR
jgi:peptide/nickel transport system substrate-binding protein